MNRFNCAFLFFFFMMSAGITLQAQDNIQKLEYFSFPSKKVIRPSNRHRQYKYPRILSICTLNGVGGIETSTLELHKTLLQNKYEATMLVGKNIPIQQELCTKKISHYASHACSALTNNQNKISQTEFIKHIRQICVQHSIDIIQCNLPDDVPLACKAVDNLKTKVILFYHAPTTYGFKLFHGLDGVITVNKTILQLLKKANKALRLNIAHLMHLFPFFDEKKCLIFVSPSITRETFFQENFQIPLQKNIPLICMVGNFYGPAKKPHQDFVFQKNQELLIRAVHKLIHEYNHPVYLVFAGKGPNQAWHQELVHDLGLERYIHFVGYCTQTCHLLYYSDIHVLASKEESFGIAHIEAALHHKPSLGAEGTGAQSIIIDNITGCIFKNNDVDDLSKKLKFLLDDSRLCKLMGENAYNFVTSKETFNQKNKALLAKVKLKNLSIFYYQVLGTKLEK